MNIRKAGANDLSRIAEIYIFNNRVNFFPLFQDESFSFGELQVVPLADNYFGRDGIMENLYVFEDGVVKGFLQIDGTEICKLYVDTFFQSGKIGARLLEYAVREFHTDHLWALEKNTRALSFYRSHGFQLTGEKQFEEGTTEYIVKLERKSVELNTIETPEDIFVWMEDNIQYGWLDMDGNRHIDEMKNFRRLYRTMSMEEIWKEKIGTCIEQAWLMKVLLDKLEVPNEMFCCRVFETEDFSDMDEDEHMHCFVLFYKNNKCYHLEHPAYRNKGIWEYSTKQEALKAITDHYIKLRGGKESPTTRFSEVPSHCSFKEFNCYINSLMEKEQTEEKSVS